MTGGVLPRLRGVLGVAHSEPRPPEPQVPYKRLFLTEIAIFRDLSPEDMQWLEETTLMSTVRKGRVIYHQEDSAQGLFLLKKGRVRLFRMSPSGKKLELAILHPGTFFGEMPILGETMRNGSAEAIEDCTLCVMSQADIERLALRRPQVAIRMLEIIGRRLSESEARLEDLAYRSVPARLAAFLLRLSREHDGMIEGLTHQELGDMVGAYRETVTKILDQFQTAGYVELGRRRIRVLNRDGLAGVLEEA